MRSFRSYFIHAYIHFKSDSRVNFIKIKNLYVKEKGRSGDYFLEIRRYKVKQIYANELFT